ncbi:glycerate kinase [Bacillus anthracis]|nr:glycerate kinase [Bacillus anthracis]
MRILVVPSGFKESLGAKEAADVMKEGILKVMPLATVETLPMVDGGEGFTETIINITGGKMYKVQVMGPVGDEIQSYFGVFETRNGERTAVIEMAAAAGLRLVPRDLRDPRKTTIHGVGQLIELALNKGVDRILIGCGDSGTSDGGAGLEALIGATLHPRYDIIMKYMDLNKLLLKCDLVFTAEGSIDFQTPRGKIPAEVAKCAKRYGLPVIALVGTVGKGARINYDYGIDAYTSILPMPSSLENAFSNAEKWLRDCTESTMRTVLVGYQIASRLNKSGYVS